jgi:hypothetical protein
MIFIFKPFFIHWSWIQFVPYIWIGSSAHFGCDHSTVDAYSSESPDPTSGMSRSLCLPYSQICISNRTYEIHACSLFMLFQSNLWWIESSIDNHCWFKKIMFKKINKSVHSRIKYTRMLQHFGLLFQRVNQGILVKTVVRSAVGAVWTPVTVTDLPGCAMEAVHRDGRKHCVLKESILIY